MLFKRTKWDFIFVSKSEQNKFQIVPEVFSYLFKYHQYFKYGTYLVVNNLIIIFYFEIGQDGLFSKYLM